MIPSSHSWYEGSVNPDEEDHPLEEKAFLENVTKRPGVGFFCVFLSRDNTSGRRFYRCDEMESSSFQRGCRDMMRELDVSGVRNNEEFLEGLVTQKQGLTWEEYSILKWYSAGDD
ncbi:hypothetical protein Tco_0854008 [Tanacetum coccineum]